MGKIKFSLMAAAIVALASCGNSAKENAVQQELDSLRNVAAQQQEMLTSAEDFVQVMNSSMDSVINANADMIFRSSEGGMSSREKMKQNLAAYKQVLDAQRDKIKNLQAQLANQKGAFAAKMKETIEKLQEQLDAKEAQIAELQKELENKNADITELRANVETLTSNVNQLTSENQQQQETINSQVNQMNEAYYIIGTKKELKELGLLTGGGLLSKSKLNLNNVNVGRFTKIDIRMEKSIRIPSGSPQILTQAPADSYSINKVDKNNSTLIISNPQKFWSLTRYLVIRY